MKEKKPIHDSQASPSKKSLFVWGLILASATLVTWLLFYAQSPLPEPTSTTNVDSNDDAKIAQALAPPNKAARKKEQEELDEDPFQGREMKAQFLQVADLYKQNSRYPANSIPVVGERFAEPVKPFEQAEVDTPYPDDSDDSDPIRISASVEKIEYFAGDTIHARVLISGGGIDEYSRIETFGSVLSVNEGRNTGLSVNFERANFNEFHSLIDTRTAAPGQIPREALLNLTVKLEDGRALTQTVPFFYNGSPSARVENIVNSRQEGAFLLVPLQYNVFEAGYYFVDAILDDAQTNQPLVQLQAEGRMQFGNDILTLKAHIHALMDAGSAGPYRLRIINTFRAGTFEETRDVAATVSQPFGYDIQAVPFSQYDDTPFVDPEVQERIEFLEQLGRDDDETEN